MFAAVGLGALTAIGVGKLAWDHRKAQLEDAFRMLTVGMERLNNADAASARQQFHESIDQFRTLGRDPLMALHHELAAKLRSPASRLPEVRELTVPHSREGETLLELALSEDSTLLAVTTRERLLCFHIESERWAEWRLPQPIERAGALYVDSRTGKAHFVLGDDGRILTMDCHASGSPLVVTASSTANQPAVAWVDADELMIWVAPANPAKAEVKITAQPLPGAKGDPIEMQVAFPGQANTLFAAAVIHSIAKVGDDILLFYGDSYLFHDADLRDESVLVTSIDEPERQTNRVVFPAFIDEEGGKVRARSTHVRRLLPASAPGRVYALTDAPQGVAILGPDAKPIDEYSDSLFATAYRDGRETYDLSVKSTGKNAVMELSRRRTGARLSYELPWRSKEWADVAAISRDGRRVVVADAAGGILLIDLSKSPAP